MTLSENVDKVLAGLGELIMDSLKGVASEQYWPSANPDDMDQRIKDGKARASQLRAIREQFENIMTGVL